LRYFGWGSARLRSRYRSGGLWLCNRRSARTIKSNGFDRENILAQQKLNPKVRENTILTK
jgi:hypothetical protein